MKKLISQFIIQNNCSFRLIRSHSFKELLISLDSRVKIPSVEVIKESIHEEGLKIIQESFKTGKNMTIITDGWKSINNDTVFNVAVKMNDGIHFLESAYLHVTENAENIVDLLFNIFSEHNISFHNIVGICTDNNTTMLKTGRIIQERISKPVFTMGCMSHILNLISKKILQIEKYKEVLLYCNNIIHVINTKSKERSIIYAKLNKNIQIRKGTNIRFSSYAEVFRKVMENKNILIELEMLDDKHVSLINEIYLITDHLCKNIHLLSSDSASLSDAYKIVKELKNDIIHKSSEKSAVKVIIKKTLKKLVNYDILHLYEFLDVNSQNNLSENDKTIVKRYIFSTFKEFNTKLSKEIYFFERRKPYGNAPQDTFTVNVSTYIWYNSYGCYYPTIKQIYDIIITLPVSSCFVERSFSIQKIIHNCRRNKLNIKTINDILLVKFKIMNENDSDRSEEGEDIEVEENEEDSDECVEVDNVGEYSPDF